MADQKNFILALVLTFVILVGFQYLFPKPSPPAGQPTAEATIAAPGDIARAPGATDMDVPIPSAAPAQAAPAQAASDSQLPTLGGPPPGAAAERDAVLRTGERITIDTPRLEGSIPLTGRRIDDVLLRDYTEELDPDSAKIVMLSPAGTSQAYFAEFGWATLPGDDMATPGTETKWRADRTTLAPGQPVTLSWENGRGLRFTRTYAVDEDYMFTVTQRIVNTTSSAVTLAPYGLISRAGTPKTRGYAILHEGALGAFNDALEEFDYDDLRDEHRITKTSTGGWIGFTDKYWMTALIPDQGDKFAGRFSHTLVNGADKYQTDFMLESRTVGPGQSVEVTSRLFVGAKEVRLIDGYASALGIAKFDRAIDWGWLFFLTKPIFQLLSWIEDVIGNFGISILILTVLIKAIFFPLANKSFVQMGKMKKLQPKMLVIRETYADDKARQQQETMALYKREKVNPVGGCLPMIVQIPVFFALYKVLFVTIEMRHAPFFGWIHDLSAPDPMMIFNLFGLLPWTPPSILAIGIWPLAMGITMFLQQRLNPAATDPMQAKIFALMPVIFTFMLARFPVGLVIYWTWNNLLTMAQQWVIMKRTAAED